MLDKRNPHCRIKLEARAEKMNFLADSIRSGAVPEAVVTLHFLHKEENEVISDYITFALVKLVRIYWRMTNVRDANT